MITGYTKRTERLQRLVELMERKGTGSLQSLSDRLGVSARTIYNDFELFKHYEAEIKFSVSVNSFIFTNDVVLRFDPVVRQKKKNREDFLD